MLVLHIVIARTNANQLADEGYYGLVRCECGHEERCDPFNAIRFGWPEHCDTQMVMVNEKDETKNKLPGDPKCVPS